MLLNNEISNNKKLLMQFNNKMSINAKWNQNNQSFHRGKIKKLTNVIEQSAVALSKQLIAYTLASMQLITQITLLLIDCSRWES